MSIQKSYNIGVIGAGWIAKAHMGFLQETGRASITWIAARNPENLEKVRNDFDIPNKTHDYKDILKDPDVEVVLIATPPDTHREMFIEAIRAGKHVLLEKPMALTKEELEEMMQLKAQYPEILAMECSARHSRLNPKFTLVKELIDSGALGEIYHIHHQSVDRQNRPGIGFRPIALWFLAGMLKSRQVNLNNIISKTLGVTRSTKHRSLLSLEQAGLISVEQSRGKSPVVTLLDPPKNGD